MAATRPNKTKREEGNWIFESDFQEPDGPLIRGSNWTERKAFLEALGNLESGNATVKTIKTIRACPICEERFEPKQYIFKGYTWHAGYRHMIEFHRFNPSIEFAKFVLQKDVFEPNGARAQFERCVLVRMKVDEGLLDKDVLFEEVKNLVSVLSPDLDIIYK